MQRGSFQWMKSLNKSIILNKIRTQGPISRAQIAKETKLTPPTVGSIVKELLEQGIVKESEQGTSKGGRKPTMLVIHNNAFYVIGIDAGPKDIRFILSDLSGSIMERSKREFDNGLTKNQLIKLLKEGVSDILDRRQGERNKVIGIGVAMHGVVDVTNGISLYAPNLKLRDIPIKQELEQAFDLTVKVENDARSMALGEAWFGNSQNVSTMMVMNIGRGIGAGIIIDGHLYHGEYDLAGEVGHMSIDINGKLCYCGNKGCLQTLASGPAMEEAAALALNKGYSGVLQEMVKTGDSLTGETIYKAALKGDTLSNDLMADIGRYIGVGITNLIHVLNPKKIILGGGVTNAGTMLLNPIKDTIKQQALTPQAAQTDIIISQLGKDATVLGAVALLLVELFNVNEANVNN